MARQLYYRDSYGRVHRARAAGRGVGRTGMPAFPVLKVLMILAALMVLASLVH